MTVPLPVCGAGTVIPGSLLGAGRMPGCGVVTMPGSACGAGTAGFGVVPWAIVGVTDAVRMSVARTAFFKVMEP